MKNHEIKLNDKVIESHFMWKEILLKFNQGLRDTWQIHQKQFRPLLKLHLSSAIDYLIHLFKAV